MRKRSCDRIFDNIFWYTIYLLPIILTVVQSIGIFENFTFADWENIYENYNLNDFSFQFLLDYNLEALCFARLPPVFTAIDTFLMNQSWIQNEYTDVFTRYFWYLIVCNIMHLFIDFILFIPRLCHKWMNAFTRSED